MLKVNQESGTEQLVPTRVWRTEGLESEALPRHVLTVGVLQRE